MENINSFEFWIYNLSTFQTILLLIGLLYVVILLASNCYFLITYSNSIPWTSYWSCNIEESKDFIVYNNMTTIGKILCMIIFIIPRLIILTPAILIYMVLMFIWNLFEFIIYKRR